jgi:NAD(P) transhydrogenase subunit alpha
MRIVSVSENHNIEKRIAITPNIAQKYMALGLEVSLTENYGEHLGFKDKDYKELGVQIFKNESEVLGNADIIVQLGLLSDDNLLLLK